MIGHNPKAHQQPDDWHEISALLRELPRVTAPTDFNASLKARVAAAKAEAHEFADLTTLVKELPRVAAPADFDFKLRARIAQAKAEQQKASSVGTGWFAGLFGQSFSWLQAGAAMAAVALVVSLVTMGVLRSNPSSPPESTTMATVTTTQSPAPTNDLSVPQTVTPVVAEGRANIPIRANTIKYSPRPVAPSAPSTGARNNRPDNLPDNLVAASAEPMVATKVMIKHRSGEARMVNPSEYNLGLQAAHLRPTPAKAVPSDATVNIY